MDKRLSSLRITILYALISVFWISFSDKLLTGLTTDYEILVNLQTYKGWGFVAITSVLLYILINKYSSQILSSEESLKRSEELWKFALEGAGDGVWDWNAQTNEVFFSRRWKEMLGYEEHEIRNTLDELDTRVHPDDKKMVYGEIEKHFRGETDVYVSEHRMLCKDGTYKWILDRGKIVTRTDEGKPLRVVGTHTDITERKRAEEALQKSEEQFRVIASHTPDHILMQDSELKYLFVINPQLGLTEQDMIGKTDYDFLSKEEADKLTEIKNRVLKTGKPVPLETSLISQAGNPEFFEGTFVPRFDGRGQTDGLIGYFRNVTKRKKAERLLKEHEALLNEVGNIAKIGGWEMDMTTGKATWSKGTYDIVEIDYDKPVPGLHEHLGYYLPEYREMIENKMKALIETKQPITFDAALKTAKGNIKWCQAFGEAVVKDGKLIKLQGTFQDITERKRAEEELRASEKRYHSLFDNMLEGFAYCQMFFDGDQPQDYVYLEVNQAFEELTGLKNIVGKKVTEVIPGIKESDPELFASLGRVSLTGKPEKFEIYLESMGIWFSLSVYSPEKEYFVAVFDVITKRKKAEEALRYHEALLEETGRLAKIGGWEFDPIAGKGTWTDEVARIHDLDLEEDTDVEIGLSYYHGESRTKIEAAVKEAIEFGKPYDLELELITDEGNHKWVRTIGHPVIENKKVVKVRGSFQDITERKRAEEELKKYREHLEDLVKERTDELEQANIRLKELDRLKSMFIASMSHELRTPLNSVIGFSSILMKDWVGTLNDEQKNMSSIILRAGKHLLLLINDVIDVSKIEAGMIDIHHDDFDIDDVITDAVESLAKEIEGKGLLLNVETIHQQMHTDRSRLLQCILNLLSNAAKFTEKGNITVQTRIVNSEQYSVNSKKLNTDDNLLTTDIDFVEISVTDTGIGIQEEDIPKLFQAFVRLETPLKTVIPGTGLGLYLTRKLITEVLQGDITVESEYGKGSRFIIKIPISVNSEK